MSENAERFWNVTMDYRPHEGRVIRIEGRPIPGGTPPVIEFRKPVGAVGSGLTEGLLAALIASFTIPSRRRMDVPEGWNERREEWERQRKLATIRSQLT